MHGIPWVKGVESVDDGYGGFGYQNKKLGLLFLLLHVLHAQY